MNDLGRILGLCAFVLLGAWRIYWFVTGQKADRAKPKTEEKHSLFDKRNIVKLVTLLLFGIVGVQLLGVQMLPMPEQSPPLQIFGMLVVLIGLGIAVVGRHTLGTNWANCYDYQVKRKQELVTNGIYSYIRHPLYSGIAFFFIGAELIVQSYLVYLYLLSFFAAYIQARWEEKLLIQHFGDQYRRYMKRTKRFIPFVW